MPSEKYEKGLAIRREVLGTKYVEASLASADAFTMPMQELATEVCWGSAWARDGLPRKTRSLVNLAMLTALDRQQELKLHVRAAIDNGCTVLEIREVLLHAATYCGVPAGLEAFRSAREALREAGIDTDKV